MTNKSLAKSFAIVLAAAAALGVSTGASAAKGSYLIMGAGNALPKGIEKQVSRLGGTVQRTMPGIGMAVVVSNRADFAAKAGKISGVSEVLPNLTVRWIDPTNNVAVTYDEVGMPPTSDDDDFFYDLQWGDAAVNAPGAWNLGYRGAGTLVAVLDTGFDLDHPDLEPNINMTLSKDFTGEGLQYTLPNTFSHGTHTAGTIAAADNGFGTIGIAPEATLMLVKVLGDAGSGSFADIISGIVYATDKGADIISMSLGATLYRHGGCDDPADPESCYSAAEAAGLINAVNKATTYAYQHGVTVVAAAGNEALDFNHTRDVIHTPSNGPHVISVAATAPIGWAVNPSGSMDYLASYSNYGASGIDFSAPGGDAAYPGNENCIVAGLVRPCWVFDLVFSTGNGGWYWSAGTSMATPHVAGVAALIIGKNGGSMPPAQVAAILRASSDDIGKPGKDAFGFGRVNAYNAVK